MAHFKRLGIVPDCKPICEGSQERSLAFAMRTLDRSDARPATYCLTISNRVASASRTVSEARALAGGRRIILHDYRAAFDDGEWLAEALDARSDALGGAEVEDHDMVLAHDR